MSETPKADIPRINGLLASIHASPQDVRDMAEQLQRILIDYTAATEQLAEARRERDAMLSMTSLADEEKKGLLAVGMELIALRERAEQAERECQRLLDERTSIQSRMDEWAERAMKAERRAAENVQRLGGMFHYCGFALEDADGGFSVTPSYDEAMRFYDGNKSRVENARLFTKGAIDAAIASESAKESGHE